MSTMCLRDLFATFGAALLGVDLDILPINPFVVDIHRRTQIVDLHGELSLAIATKEMTLHKLGFLVEHDFGCLGGITLDTFKFGLRTRTPDWFLGLAPGNTTSFALEGELVSTSMSHAMASMMDKQSKKTMDCWPVPSLFPLDKVTRRVEKLEGK